MNTTVIYLISAGADPLAVMAALRSAFTLSLGAARGYISSCPKALPPVDTVLATQMMERLTAAGAQVSLTPPAADNPAPKPEHAPAPKPESRGAFAWDIPAPEPVTEPDSPAPTVRADFSRPRQEPVTEPGAPAAYPEVRITCYGTGEYKLRIVKAVTEITGMRLAPAKELVDSWPATFSLPRPQAEKLRDAMTELGLRAEIEGEPTSASAPASAPATLTIRIPDPGPRRMQLIPLLKRELKMKYADAADIAEKGGDVTAPDVATAARICEALRTLGIYYQSV